MNTLRHETRILRCDERGCGVPFMVIKSGLDGQDAKIGLAQPRKVARDLATGHELVGTCPRHKE